MVELPEMFSPQSMAHVLRTLISRDLVPVITHPERNPELQRTPSLLREWIDLGCLGQVTAQSLTGRFGKRAGAAGWDFVRSGCIQFVASDAHDIRHRPPRLDEARATLARQLGEVFAQCLTTEYPLALIENREVPVDDFAGQLRRRKWYQFWR
jgi:protein-tyrosine phosphatase